MFLTSWNIPVPPIYYSLNILPIYVCLFVVSVPLKNFSLIWRHICHYYGWKAANFDTFGYCVVRVKILLCVLHLLWYGKFIYNCHLRGPVPLSPIVKCLAVELSQPVLTTYVCHGWDSNTQHSACMVNSLTNRATVAVPI